LYMQQRYYEPLAGRFLSVDPVTTDAKNAEHFNRYRYAANNPYKYKDPTGRIFETAFDVFSLALSVAEFKSNPSIGNAIGVAIDAAAVAIPGIPGGVGAVRAAASTANKVGDAASATTKAAGLPKPPTGAGSVPPGQRDPKRTWTKEENKAKLQEQGGNCANCGNKTSADNAAGHHVDRHADGGKTDATNQAVVCTDCHKELHSGK
jgi:uncharacterized protein RhaS with RHS repeats